MKKKVLYMAIVLIGLTAACKKDSNNDEVSRLQGIWQAEKEISLTYQGDKEIKRRESLYTPGEFTMEFKKDSVFFSNEGRPGDRYAYTITNGELNLRQGNGSEHLGFKLINNAQFILSTEDIDTNSSGVVERDVDEYHFKKE